jgi:ribosomal protein L30/L7E
LKYHKQKSYPELFMLDKVMVTQNTAPLYAEDRVECAAPAEGWGECTLSPQRSNFFGTIGFLISKPSSVFSSNNNYGRGGDTFSTIFGEELMANTDGISGERPKPIPLCLNKTKDKRWKKDKADPGKIAPWGAISVPFYGRVCQGCHLNRHLAAAAVVFRPFGKAGEIIRPEAIDDPNGPYAADLKDDDKLFVYHTETNETDHQKLTDFQPVNADYYKKLLTELEKPDVTCFPDPRDPQNPDKVVQANTLGLNRIMPSVFLNSTKTNLEVITAVNKAFNENQGRLEPMMRAFFATETFGCSSK